MNRASGTVGLQQKPNDDVNRSAESQEKKAGGAAEGFRDVTGENFVNLAKGINLLRS